MDINNADDFKRAVEADELADKMELAAEGSIKMSVREYAKARSVQPQLVYYYIRKGAITQDPCGECGRKVINVKEADAIFLKGKDDDSEN